MDIAELIAPWLSLLMILVPLIFAEQWIHRHVFGISYLMTENKESATGVYYIFFFPGVLLHEIIQYFVAGALDVPIKKIQAYPKPQDNGTLRYDFVSIKPTDPIRASIIGGAPFIIAGFFVYTISTSILDLHSLPAAIGTQDTSQISSAVQDLLNTPNFWFWLYLLFVISNGMIPTKEDRQGWRLILAVIGGFTLILILIGSHQVVTETLNGPVRESLELVTTSLAIILGLDVLVILFLRIVENSFERIRGYRVNYNTGEKKKTSQKTSKRPVGSNLPIPKGEPMPSIYNLELPLPSLPPKRSAARTIQRAADDVASGRPPSPTESRPSPASPRVAPSGPARNTAEVPALSVSSEPDEAPAKPSTTFSRPTSSSPTPASTGTISSPSSPLSRQSPSETTPSAEGATEQLRPSFSRPSPSTSASSSTERPARTTGESEATSRQSTFRRSSPLDRPSSTSESKGERPSIPSRRSTSESDALSSRLSSGQRPPTPSGSSSSSPLSPRRPIGALNTDEDKDGDKSPPESPARPTGRTSPLSSFSRDRSALANRSGTDSQSSSPPSRPRSPFNREQTPSRFPTNRQSRKDDDVEAEDDVEYVDFDDA